MEVTLQQLIERLREQGLPATLEGDGSTVVTAVNTLEDATDSELSFLANPRYERQLETTNAAAVIVPEQSTPSRSMTLIRTAEPYQAFMKAVVLIHGHRIHPQWGVHPSAVISRTARLGKDANVGPNVTIEEDAVIGDRAVLYPGCYVGRGSRLGDDVTLYANAVVYDLCRIGSRVTIHSGTVIGEDGLGYAPVGEQWDKIPQVGRVIIEDDVEIGANCTIDRATIGTTVIGRGSKFSNLIAIGHGSKVGENAMFVAQVGLAGSVTVGRHVQMGGQAGVAGHITIGDNATIGAKAGVASDVDADEFVLGQPATKASEAKRAFSLTHKLPEFKQRLKALEAEIADIRDASQG